MRRVLLTAVVLATSAWLPLFPAQSGAAGRVVTWKTQSRHVEPERVEFGRATICPHCAPHPRDALYVNVFLPEGYDGRRRFPVLYLLHGSGGQYDFWMGSPRENDPRGGIVPGLAADFPAIIVMPDAGATGGYVNWWNGGRRGDPAWERYHLEELVHLVERRLKVRRGRRFRAIAGFSMGGYGAAFYGTQRPGYFGIVAALSAHLSIRDLAPVGARLRMFGNPVAQAFYWAGHDPVELVRNLRWSRVYVSAGDSHALPGEPSDPRSVRQEDIARSQSRRFVATARAAGVSVDFRMHTGEHSYDLGWRSFEDALPWIADSFGRPLPQRPNRWRYTTVAKRSTAFGFRFRFAQAPSSLISFTRDGHALTGRGTGRVAVRLPDGTRTRLRLPFRRILR